MFHHWQFFIILLVIYVILLLKTQDALNLPTRPFCHNTTLVIFVWAVLILMSAITSRNVWRFSWIILTAGLSHHLRDGIKHGLLLEPFGSTILLPYWCYILATALLPHLIRLLMGYYEAFHERNETYFLQNNTTIKKKEYFQLHVNEVTRAMLNKS